MMVLPGSISAAEINVAVGTNMARGVSPTSLLRTIAQIVADADIPLDYDLLDPQYRCHVTPSVRQQPAPDQDQDQGTASTATPEVSPDPIPTATSPPVSTSAPTSTPTPAPTRTPIRPRSVPTPKPAPASTPEPARPQLGRPSADPDEIWTQLSGRSCGPTETRVQIRVTAASALRSVELRWSVHGHTGSRTMQHDGAGLWSGTLGPFDPDALPEHERSVPVTVTVIATDDLGESAAAEMALPLTACPPDLNGHPGARSPSSMRRRS